jgi:hypothetical protein
VAIADQVQVALAVPSLLQVTTTDNGQHKTT